MRERIAFPSRRAGRVSTPSPLIPPSISLRPLRADDTVWLRDLYASTRSEELAPMQWPAATKRAFLDDQFERQHDHFVAYYAESLFLAVIRRDEPIGRLYLLQAAPGADDTADLIVDISLFPAARGEGIGSALLRQVQSDAGARGLRLHVAIDNLRARTLYERLGFVVDRTEVADSHLEMRWLPARN